MRGENLFSAIGKADEKYTSDSGRKINRRERSETAETVFRIVGAAASVLLVAGTVLAIWLPSIWVRDPVSPASSDTAASAETKDEGTYVYPFEPGETVDIGALYNDPNHRDEEKIAAITDLSEAVNDFFARTDIEQNYKRVINLDIPVCDATLIGIGYEFPNEVSGVFRGYRIKTAAKQSGQNGFLSDESSYTSLSGPLSGNSYDWIAFIAPEDAEFEDVRWSEQIGDYTFYYETSQKLTVRYNGKICYGLKEAYDSGVLKEEAYLDLAALCFDSEHCVKAGAKQSEIYKFTVNGTDITGKAAVTPNRASGNESVYFAEYSLTALVEALGGSQTVLDPNASSVRFDLPGGSCVIDLSAHTVRSEKYTDPDYDAKWFDANAFVLYYDKDKGVVTTFSIIKTFIREFCSADTLVNADTKTVSVISRITGKYRAELQKALDGLFKAKGSSPVKNGTYYAAGDMTCNGILIDKAVYRNNSNGEKIYFVQIREYKALLWRKRTYGGTTVGTNYGKNDLLVLCGTDLYYTLADAFHAGVITEADIASMPSLFYGYFAVDGTEEPSPQNEYDKITAALKEYFGQQFDLINPTYKRIVPIPDYESDTGITYAAAFESSAKAGFDTGPYKIHSASKVIRRYDVTAADGLPVLSEVFTVDEPYLYFAFISDNDRAYTAMEWSETIEGYTFKYMSGMKLTVVNTLFRKVCYGLKEAYDSGLISGKDLAAAAMCFGTNVTKDGFEPERYTVTVDGKDVTDKVSVTDSRPGYGNVPTVMLSELAEELGGSVSWAYDGGRLSEIRFFGSYYRIDVPGHTIEKSNDYDGIWFEKNAHILYVDNAAAETGLKTELVTDLDCAKQFLEKTAGVEFKIDESKKTVAVTTKPEFKRLRDLTKAMNEYFSRDRSNDNIVNVNGFRMLKDKGTASGVFNGISISSAMWSDGNRYFIFTSDVPDDTVVHQIKNDGRTIEYHGTRSVTVMQGKNLYELWEAYENTAVSFEELELLSILADGIDLKDDDDGLILYIKWGAYLRSYYSRSGRIIDVSSYSYGNGEEDYSKVFLTEEQKKEIIETLDRIGIENYPEFYDPFAEHKSLDKQDVILYVSYNGKTKLIKCFDVPPFTEPAADEKGADFISLCDMLINTVTSAGKTDG